MWTDVVVLSDPLVDDDLCLLCCGEPFGVKHLVAQGAVEALVVSVLPGRSGLDPDGLDADPGQPVLHCLCAELGTIVRADVFRSAVAQEQRVQRLKYILGPHPGADRHSQGLPGVLVQNGQHLVAPPAAKLVVHGWWMSVRGSCNWLLLSINK